jgi:hypothetical protein
MKPMVGSSAGKGLRAIAVIAGSLICIFPISTLHKSEGQALAARPSPALHIKA